MMPTLKEVRKKIVKKGERQKEKNQILTKENEKLKNPFFCPHCGTKIER